MEFEKKQYFNAEFSKEFEKVNEDFLKCTVSLVTHEQIANGTKFTEMAIENARYSLNYLPVIGWFKKDSDGDDDFSTHGIEYVIDDEGIKEVCHTVPFGVIIPNSSRYEMMTIDNGEKQKYLVADCYMWKRYSEAIEVIKENKCNQSVEVEIKDYEYNSNYLEVKDFNFTGVCVLSEDVAPAFNLAKIRTTDKFSKDEFKSCFEEMSKSLDKFLNFEKGDEVMEENIIEEVVVEVNNEEFAKKKRKCSKCEQEIDFDGEFDENEEYVCEECQAEVVTEEEVSEDFEAKYNEVLTELDGLKVEFTDLQTELATIKNDYSDLEAEAQELRQFKADIEFEAHKTIVDDELAKYSELESVDGYSEIIKDKYECDLAEKIKEIKIFAYDNGVIIGKKNAKKNFTKETVKVPVHINSTSEELSEAEKRYGRDIKKYLKK